MLRPSRNLYKVKHTMLANPKITFRLEYFCSLDYYSLTLYLRMPKDTDLGEPDIEGLRHFHFILSTIEYSIFIPDCISSLTTR